MSLPRSHYSDESLQELDGQIATLNQKIKALEEENRSLREAILDIRAEVAMDNLLLPRDAAADEPTKLTADNVDPARSSPPSPQCFFAAPTPNKATPVAWQILDHTDEGPAPNSYGDQAPSLR